MPTLFPDNYETANIAKRKKLARNVNLKNELSALDIALHAHDIFAYLKKHDVEKPNSSFVSLFQYAAEALGVPYEVIEEAFFTERLFQKKSYLMFLLYSIQTQKLLKIKICQSFRSQLIFIRCA